MGGLSFGNQTGVSHCQREPTGWVLALTRSENDRFEADLLPSPSTTFVGSEGERGASSVSADAPTRSSPP